MKKFFLLFYIFISSSAYPRVLESFLASPPSDYELSIITAGRGGKIYMLGGHLLLRVRELKENGKDVSVNWGIFDFHDPNFIVNYALGKLDYSVVASSTRRVMGHYRDKRDNRKLYENKLNLTDQQKETLLEIVSWWLKPENSTYRYHFFDNNCSTIIRDILSEVLGKEFDKQLTSKEYKTFRHMGRQYFSNYPFFAFMAPVLFNSDADLPISYWERFRVPVEAPEILSHVKQVDDDGNKLSSALLGPKETIQEGDDIDFETFEYSLLVLLFFSLLFILSTLCKNIRGKSFFKFRVLGFSLFSLGLFNFFWSGLMLILWIFTEHTYTFHNAHLLVLWPLDLIFSCLGIYMIFKNRYPDRGFLSWTSCLLLKAHFFGLCLHFLLWQTGWIKQDVSFIYFYLLGPYLLFAITLLKDFSSAKRNRFR